jgi:hypothetical protein
VALWLPACPTNHNLAGYSGPLRERVQDRRNRLSHLYYVVT